MLLPSKAHTLTPVYDELYGIAQWLREESERWQEHSNAVAESRCALACILHCFLALESYINTYATLAAHLPDSPISAGALEKLETLPSDSKWLLFPLLFTGRAVFDPGHEPMQSFGRLKRMRDHFIVHHKPQLRTEVTVDTSAREGRPAMAIRGMEIPHTALGDWVDPQCNADGARWACDLVVQMIDVLTREAKAAGPGPMPPPHLTVFSKPSDQIPELAPVSIVIRHDK